jgi:hypothetical protein
MRAALAAALLALAAPAAALVALAAPAAALVALAAPAAADDRPTLLVLAPEMIGDLEAPGLEEAWPARLERLRAEVGAGLAEAGLYDLTDEAAAEAAGEANRGRANLFTCEPCAVRAAEAADADRVLALRVHRISSLIMSLQAILRDAEGDVLFQQQVGFRGDTDTAWDRAGLYLVREMAGRPADRQ